MKYSGKTIFWSLFSVTGFLVILVMLINNPPVPKEQIQRNVGTLSLAQKSDLIHFNNAWFILIQNHKKGEQVTLKDSRDESINTYPYSIVVGYKDFKSLTNPMPNNDYSKILLNYFVGVSN